MQSKTILGITRIMMGIYIGHLGLLRVLDSNFSMAPVWNQANFFETLFDFLAAAPALPIVDIIYSYGLLAGGIILLLGIAHWIYSPLLTVLLAITGLAVVGIDVQAANFLVTEGFLLAALILVLEYEHAYGYVSV
jgi:hypothetical protein